MHSFKPAARRGGRYAGFLLFSAFFLLVSLHSGAAFSASLAVKIRQINPTGAVQQVTCVEKQKCILSLKISTKQGQQEDLNVTISSAGASVIASFQTPKGYLYSRNQTATDKNSLYETFWHSVVGINKPALYDITLFLPEVPQSKLGLMLSVAREAANGVVHAPVADIEFSALLTQ